MGIRVHKFLGYGLTDLQYDKETLWNVTDPRVNPDCFLFTHEDVPSIEEYATWLETNETDMGLERMFLKDRHKTPRCLTEAIAFSPEYGESNVLVLRPLSAHDWDRYDDAIDYVEETELAGDASATNRVDILANGIYPYSGTFMNTKTGEQIGNEASHYRRLVKMSQVQQSPALLDQLASNLGFDNHSDAQSHLAPIIPEGVLDFCRFTGLFTEESFAYQLRPMLYTYWS